MASYRVIYALLGVSAPLFLGLQTLARWDRERINKERVKLLAEAVEQAEERCVRLQLRHDRILDQATGKYFVRQYLEAALQRSQTAMNEATEFSTSLQGLLLEALKNYPHDIQV